MTEKPAFHRAAPNVSRRASPRRSSWGWTFFFAPRYKCLDPRGKGVISFKEFYDICHGRLHYRGNVNKVFSTLDAQRANCLCMTDFNPRAHECLKDISFQLSNRFGNVVDAFHPYHIGTSNEIDLESWMKLNEGFGFKSHDLKNVFEWLDVRGTRMIRGSAIELAKNVAPKMTQVANMSQEERRDLLVRLNSCLEGWVDVVGPRLREVALSRVGLVLHESVVLV